MSLDTIQTLFNMEDNEFDDLIAWFKSMTVFCGVMFLLVLPWFLGWVAAIWILCRVFLD